MWHLWGRAVRLATWPARAYDHITLKVWCWLLAHAEWDDNALEHELPTDDAP